MKKLILYFAMLFILPLNFSFAQQDIVNGDFEFWDTIPGTNGLEDPIGWRSNNYGIYNIPGSIFITGISKSPDAYSGNYSLKVTPSNHPVGITGNSVRVIHTNDTCTFLSSNFGLVNCTPSQVTYHYEKIVGYYKFVPDIAFGDTAGIVLSLYTLDSNNSINQTTGFAIKWFTASSSWTWFELPVYHYSPLVEADIFDLRITFFSNNNLINPAGYLLIDSLALVPSVPTSLDKKPKVNLKLLPNPAQEKLSVESNLSFTSFELCDLAGRIIAGGPFEKEMDVGFLSKGIYFVRLQSENQILVEKFVKE